MENLAIVCGAAIALCVLFANNIRAKHPYGALWVSGIAGAFIVVGLCASLHAKWLRDEPAKVGVARDANRPWLNVIGARAGKRIVEGEPFYIEIACKNTGPTPGTIIAKGMSGGTAKTLEEAHDRIAALLPLVIDEGNRLPVATDIICWLRGSEIKLPNLAFAKTCNLFVGGLLVYTDVTGIARYETEFCFLYDWPSNQFYADEKYSRMT